MGKQKKQRFREKVNPTGLPSMKDVMKKEEVLKMICAPTGALNLNSVVDDILKKLQYPSEETKEAACLTLICLLNQDEGAQLILKTCDIVKSVLCLLHDSSDRVKSAAAGFFRNLSALSTEACLYLISNDILTPLIALFSKYGVDYDPKVEKNKSVASSADTLVQIIHLYTNLCEASDIATSRLIEDNILQLLIRYLDISIFGKNISIAAAQCIYCACEDNVKCCVLLSEVSAKQMLWGLLNVDDEDLNLLKTLCAGVLFNISAVNTQFDAQNECVGKIIPVLLQSISKDTKRTIEDITELMSAIKSEKDSAKLKIKNANLNSEIGKIENSISSRQFALEILTNMCGSDDNDSNYETDDENEVDMELDTEIVNDGNEAVGKISTELHDAIVHSNLAAIVLQQSIILSENVVQILSSHPLGGDILKKMSSQSVQCLHCFHNIVSVLKIDELGGINSIYDTWLQLAEQAFTGKDNLSDSDLIEARSSVLRELISLLEKTKESVVCELLMKSNLELMFTAYKDIVVNTSVQTNCRVNFIRVLGSVGTILMGKNGVHMKTAEPVIKEIGVLLSGLVKDSELLLMSEALDTLIDLFSEDYTDGVAKAINLCQCIISAQVNFTCKLKACKKAKEWIHPVTRTVKDNLTPFINYKKQRLR